MEPKKKFKIAIQPIVYAMGFLFLSLGWSQNTLTISKNTILLPSVDSVLKYSVFFYGAQRSGEGNTLLEQHPIKTGCHLQDGMSNKPTVDLSGGWMDAGDFLKFSKTIAWSSYELLKAYDVFPNSFSDFDNGSHHNQKNGIPDVLDEVKVATDYLLKILLNDTTLVSRVGGAQDHEFTKTCKAMSLDDVVQGGNPRPVILGAKADIAGIASASLALMALKYHKFDSAYALKCFKMAQKLYEFGLKNQGTTQDPYYPEGECGKNSYDIAHWKNDLCREKWTDGQWKDAMMAGAVELYKNQPLQILLDSALSWNSAIGSHYWVIDWLNYVDLARHSLVQIGYGQAAEKYWTQDVNSMLSKVSQDSIVFGLAYYGDWGSLRYALNAAYSVALYQNAFPTQRSEKLNQFSKSQYEWAFGKNPYHRSFVTGLGINPPKKPHHKNSWGYDTGEHFTSKKPHLYPLIGALVGGPHLQDIPLPNQDISKKGYQDRLEDYVSNEVSLDYNAGLVGVAAFIKSLK